MRELIVITGPIGSGKSTVADLLARRYASTDHAVAVVDLDDLVFAQHGGRDLAELWRRAGIAHAALVAGWFDTGVDVVIAHGPFFESRSYGALFASAPTGTLTRHIVLTVPFDAALQRVIADPTRPASAPSRSPGFLRSTFDAFDDQDLPAADRTFDTSTMTPSEIADALIAATTRSARP